MEKKDRQKRIRDTVLCALALTVAGTVGATNASALELVKEAKVRGEAATVFQPVEVVEEGVLKELPPGWDSALGFTLAVDGFSLFLELFHEGLIEEIENPGMLNVGELKAIGTEILANKRTTTR